MKPDPHGKPAQSTWKVMGRGGGKTWLALEPLTGRTHQLRVHCAEMCFPIVGDPIYGTADRSGIPPLHLHSRAITVPISKNKPAVTVEAPVPQHMRELLRACGWHGETAINSAHSREGGNPESETETDEIVAPRPPLSRG
jgi:tRNA pseudouridine32 synthase/23S rRNA pseudouridine746 synthase